MKKLRLSQRNKTRAREEDAGRHTERECVMSLDISEYELQMLEQQARQEQLEEECILAFQTQQASAHKNSNDMESEEDFDDEMMKCAADIERLNGEHAHEKQALVPQSGAKDEDEDDDVEEDEEEGFVWVQWKVIHSVLMERRDNPDVMATGYGKSSCFLFPP